MIVLWCCAGIAGGIAYFSGLWWNAWLFAQGARTGTTILLMAGRFALLGGLLTLASLQGAAPLLAMALGVMIGRFVVMRTVRTA